MGAHRLNRRAFIQKSTAGVLEIEILGNKSFPQLNQTEMFPRIKEYRRLGRTEAMVSDIGSGVPYSEPLLRAVIDSGVNIIETAETYNNGKNQVQGAIMPWDFMVAGTGRYS